MTPVTDRGFGLLIAYLLPGFAAICVWGEGSPVVSGWLAARPSEAPSVGGFLYVTVASIGVGLLLSTVRWAVLDPLHHRTGLAAPRDDAPLAPERLEAYRLVVDLHYRYYQFYGSFLVLFLVALAAPPAGRIGVLLSAPVARLGLVALGALFYAASRDTLGKCYLRGSAAASAPSTPSERTRPMTNGGHTPPKPRAAEEKDAADDRSQKGARPPQERGPKEAQKPAAGAGGQPAGDAD